MSRSLVFRFFLAAFCWCGLTSAVHAIPSSDPDLTEAWRLLRNGQQEELKKVCIKRLGLQKNLAQWHELLALALEGKAGAQAEVKKALAIAPQDEHIIATAGFLCAHSGNVDATVLRKLDQCTKLHPENARCHAAISACYRAMQNSNADAELALAIKSDQCDYDVNIEAAQHYMQKTNGVETESALERLTKYSPKSANAFFQRAQFELQSFRLDQACDNFKKATELNPKLPQAYAYWAKTLVKSEKYEQAAKVLTLMIENGDRSTSTLARRANCLMHSKQPAKALKDYDAAMNIIDPNNKYLTPGALHEMSRDARGNYKKYFLNRVECREQLGQIDQGIKELNMLIRADPLFSDSAMDIRQRLFRKKGLFAMALADLNALIVKDKYIADRYLARAEVLRKLGREEEAKRDIAHAQNVERTGTP